jgi:chaperonin GroES
LWPLLVLKRARRKAVFWQSVFMSAKRLTQKEKGLRMTALDRILRRGEIPMATIKPQGSRLVIQPKKAQVSKGGILLPESAQQKPKEGTVIAVGPGLLLENGQRQAMSIKIGDEVMYASYSGHEIEFESQEVIILSENDVLGVLNG